MSGYSNNIYIGYHAGSSVTTGQHNIMIGASAGFATTTGGYGVPIGVKHKEAPKVEGRVFNYSNKRRFEILDIRE